MNFKENIQNGLGEIQQLGAMNLDQVQLKTRIDTIISKSFMWMGIILLIAFGVGYMVYNYFLSGVLSPSTYSIGSIVSILAGFGLVMWISFKWNTMSYSTIAVLLVLFGVMEGFGISSVFIMYKMASVINVFLMTSGLFFALAFAGYFMKVDVTKFGSILFIGLIALIIGQVVNMFVGSQQFDIWMSVFGIIIFSGLVIYDMGIMKQMALSSDDRVELLMALSLFLNFINLFFFLLRLFGSRE